MKYIKNGQIKLNKLKWAHFNLLSFICPFLM